MLKELYLEFEDGRKERNIIHLNSGEQVKIYPQRDKIVISNCKTFKYKFASSDIERENPQTGKVY